MPQANSRKLPQKVSVPVVSSAVVIAALYFGREILLPFALSILIAFLLAPMVERLERLKLGRTFAVFFVVSLSFAALAGLGVVLGQQAYDFAYKLPEYKGNILEKVRAFKSSEETNVWTRAADALEDIRADFSMERKAGKAAPGKKTAPAAGGVPVPVPVAVVESVSAKDMAKNILTPLLAPLGSAAMILIFVIFMLLEREDLRNRLIHLIGVRQLNLTTQALDDAAERVSRYLLMQLVINVAYGLVIAVGLFFIGLPNALLWGALTALLRFVPYIGPWIAAVLPLMLALAVFDGWLRPALVLGLFLANELVSNNVFEPWLYGASTGISTVGILASAVFWSWVWGPVGLVMATPLTVCLTVMGRYVPQLGFLNTLISEDAVLPPSSRFYQRLLASDPDEANEVADSFLESHTLCELYDTVLLPTLRLAEQDRYNGDLDDAKHEFVVESTKEIVEDLGSQEKFAPTALKVETPSTSTIPPVLCLPARSAGDEVAGMMLVQLLRHRGIPARVASAVSLSGEILGQVEAEATEIVVVSALPPFGSTHARYLCKRLSSKFPNLRLRVAHWDAPKLSIKANDRLSATGVTKVVGSLSDAVKDLAGLVGG